MSDFAAKLAAFSDLALPDLNKVANQPTPIPETSSLNIGMQADELLKLNVARERGNDMAIQNPILEDSKNLSSFDFLIKYGSNAATQLARLENASGEVDRLEANTRSRTDRFGDNINNVVSGFAQSVGGVGALAAAAVSEDAGIAASEALGATRDFAQSLQSSEQANSRKLDSIRADLDTEDNQNQFERDRETDGNLIANFKSFGREVLSGATRFVEDPSTFETGLTEGMGSLLAGGPVSRGLSAGAGMIGRAAGVSSGSAAAHWGSVSAMPAAIALMESGSVFAQTVEEVMGMSAEELNENSPEYRQLISNGVSEENAKRQLASSAGRIAAAIQAPIAAAAGRLVSRFEADPVSGRSFGSFVRNILTETTEEGVQSLSGEMAGNLGVQLTADETQRISEGAGVSLSQGAILGAGTAGALQAPGSAVRGVASTVQGAVDALKARGEATVAANQTENGVSTEAIKSEIAEAKVQEPVMEQAIRTMAETPKIEPTEEASSIDPEAAVERLRGVTTMTRDDLKGMGPELIRLVAPNGTDPTSRIEMVLLSAQVAINEETSQEGRTAAGLFLLDQMDRQERLQDDEFQSVLNNADQESPEYDLYNTYSTMLSKIGAMQEVTQALDWAREKLAAPQTATTEQDIANTINTARIAPAKINENAANEVLRQADQGIVNLSEQQRNALENSVALTNAGRIYSDIMDIQESIINPEYTRENGTDIVARQIETKGGARDFQFSMEHHVKRISNAPDEQTRNQRITDLQRFAQHMNNKLDAVNRSIESGKKESYQTLGADHSWLPEESSYAIQIHGHSENSLALGRQIAAEAEMVAGLANSLIARYSNSNLDAVNVSSLDPAFLSAPKARESREKRPKENAQQRIERELQSIQREELEPPVDSEVAQPRESLRTENIEDVAAAPESTPEVITAPDNGGNQETVTELAQQIIEDNITEPDPVTNGTTEQDQSNQQDKAPVVLEVKDTIKGRYPNLVRIDGKSNMLSKAYILSRKNKSVFMDMDNPISDFADEINQLGADGLAYGIDSDQRNAWFDLLALAQEVGVTVQGEMDRMLNLKKDGNKSIREMFDSGTEIYRFAQYRNMNIAENIDGEIKYNKQLLDTAVLASIHWAVNSFNAGYPLTTQDVARLIAANEADVPTGLVERFNQTISVDQAKQSLGQTIMQFWGFEAQKNANETYTKGIVEGLAAELLKGLQENGLLEIQELDLKRDFKKTFNRVNFNTRPEEIQELVKSINKTGTLLADGGLSASSREGWFIGEPSQTISQNQIRNPMVETTTEQRKVIEKAQNIPFYYNDMVADFISAMGSKNFMVLMGGKDVDMSKLHPSHRESIEGKNRSLIASFNNVLANSEKLKNHADKAGVNPADLPSYYEFAVSSVGRLQMQGSSNPQADKLAREVFMPTKVTLDMSDPLGSDARGFWMTVGQGIGIKTEKLYRDDVIQQTKDKMNGEYALLIKGLRSWLKNRGELSPEIMTQLMAAAPSMHGVHSLLAVAKYANAREAGELNEFVHYNYLEADGKTNGPINSLMLLTRGEFTAEWMKLVGKGGVYFGRGSRSLNEHVKEDTKDLYETVSDALVENQANLINSLDDELLPQFGSFQRILAALNVDVTFKPSDDADGMPTLQMKRGIAKNPLTITIYGSGVDGIAGKVTAELVDAIYEKMSEYNLSDGQTPIGDMIMDGTGKAPYGQDKFVADITKMLNIAPYKDKKSNELKLRNVPVNKNQRSEKSTFSASEFNNFKANVRIFLVDQLNAAIEQEVMGSVKSTTDTIQRATQAQSILLAGIFRNEVIAALAERVMDLRKGDADASYKRQFPDWRKGDFLSQNELDKIRKNLDRYSPYISTGTQNFLMSGGEQSDLFETVNLTVAGEEMKISMPSEFSRAMAGDLTSPAYVNGFGLAGVRGIPSLVIGTGDGQMIQNILMDDIKGLPVFDGFNLDAKNMDIYSERINKAVYKTWTNNPMRAVADSFRAFMQANPVDQISSNNPFNTQRDWMLTQLSDMLHNQKNAVAKGKEKINDGEVSYLLNEIMNDLNNISDEIDKRQNVLKNMPVSIDQMASAESPYVREGMLKLAPNSTQEQVLAEMNRLLNGEAVFDAVSTVQYATPEMEKAVNQFTTTDTDSGAKVANIFGLGAIVSGSKMPKNLREFADQALGSMADHTVVFGTVDQLNAWEASNQPETYTNNSGLGKYNPLTKTLFIVNASPETLVHEMLHAATIDKTRAYYENPESLSETDRNAFQRMESLMNEWIIQNYDIENSYIQEARRQALTEVNIHINAGRKGAALNEFMAWALTNQNLIESLKKTKVQHPLSKIVQSAITAIKRLIWGDGRRGPQVGNDTFSNLRFNAQVIMSTPTPIELLRQDMGNVALHQSASFGSNQRLTDIYERFTRKIGAYLVSGDNEIYITKFDLKTKMARINNTRIAQSFVAHGFAMTPQELSTFEVISTALSVETELNTSSLSRIQEIYEHVTNNISVADFTDDSITDQNEREFTANERFNVVTGAFLTEFDESGRSSLMPSFLALAMVNDQFRDVLSGIKKPKSIKNTDGTLDSYLENLGNSSVDNLSMLMSGERRNDADVRSVLDSLTMALTEHVDNRKTMIEEFSENTFEKANGYLVNAIDVLGERAVETGSNIGGTTGKTLKLIGQIISKDGGTLAAEGITSMLNSEQANVTWRELASEIIGRNGDNANIFDMISKARSVVDQTRQQFREKLPKQLREQFSRDLTKREWSDLHYGLARTDLASLIGSGGLQQALKYLTDKSERQKEIARLEAQLSQTEGTRSQTLIAKSQQLARFMMTGEQGANLLRNAKAVSLLNGETGRKAYGTTDKLIPIIDQLVSLYSIDNLDLDSLVNLDNMVTNERVGVEYVFSAILGTRNSELKKNKTIAAELNHYKGYIPAENQEGVSLLVRDSTEGARLIGMGYTKVAPYKGTTAEIGNDDWGYYYAPINGKGKYNQGVMQTVHQTASGVDPRTGYTVGALTAGRIVDPQKVRNVSNLIRKASPTNENLMPIWDVNGRVVAYERGVDPQQLARLNKSYNLADMLGVWRGRQVEERLSGSINENLVDSLYEDYQKGIKDKRVDEFVRLDKSDDPIHKEAYSLIPYDAREYIESVFDKGFYVRRNNINDAVGFRQASVGDSWTGDTRLKPAVQKEIQKIAMGIFGNKAYTHLVSAEKMVQDFVTEAKILIVVKSVVVPAANLVANLFQLSTNGVPMRKIFEGAKEKTNELNAYIKRRDQEVRLDADLLAARGRNDDVSIRKISNQLQSIRDSYKRMSIWPLIENGEFSAISEGGVSREELALASGKWSNIIDDLQNKVPAGLKQPYRYAMLTRDTPLFQALAKATQYGDFLGKAILYDDLRTRRGMTQKEALAFVNEEYVNYNRLAGRTRNYAEATGLIWFWNFKLRSMKVAARTIKRHPLRALMFMGMTPDLPLTGAVGSPLNDSMGNVVFDGRLGGSIGWGMAFRAPSLNPWAALTL